MKKWILILLSVILISRPFFFAWVLRKGYRAQGGFRDTLQRMWEPATKEQRGAMVIVTIRQVGYVLLGAFFLAAAFTDPPIYLILTGIGLFALSAWPFRLLIIRWIR